jgi:hypothetical protein
LASADWTGGTVHLWEVATGQEFQQFVGHQGRAFNMAFSADGTLLLTGNDDTTALVWDVTGQRTNPRAGPLPAADLKSHWADLGKEDAPRAQQAVGILAAVPGQALPFLRQRLQPIRPADPKRLARLLAGLDGDDFRERERAGADLEGLGEAAEPALRRALERASSPELRSRSQRLLEKLDAAPQRLRTRRALQVLEQSGTAEAREVLRGLAAGVPDAWLTQEAKASLGRLARRPGAEP